jgi:Na+/H+ antiporter NhaD/arsenite permease-like protein
MDSQLAAAQTPAWTVLPFAGYLLVLAVAPLLLGRFWKKNGNKLLVTIAASVPAAGYLLSAQEGPLLLESLKEYAAFMVLLASLFVISASVYLKGSLAGTPLVNTVFLALGAVLASCVGTTGASMLLIRPLLRANEKRERKTHLVVFFIFIVSNSGGLLTPLGDPPLFLGFLRGVPFLWTLQLLGPWALVNGMLLLIFNVLDQAILNREKPAREGSQVEELRQGPEPLRLQGTINFLWLLGVLAINSAVGYLARRNGWGDDLEKLLLIAGMGAMASLSLLTTSREIRQSNQFTWGPLIEVAVLFIGIFTTMVPATLLLGEMGASGAIKITHAWEFFWGSGALSSFLDNAPTYVTFASLACGVVGGQVGQTLNPSNLGQLLAYPQGVLFLKAVSCGAVFMGAATYVGNGPNFMVKAIAEENNVRMPSFFGYLAWSGTILFPLYVVVTFLFFR